MFSLLNIFMRLVSPEKVRKYKDDVYLSTPGSNISLAAS